MGKNSRLCLRYQASVQRQRVEGVGEAVLHVLIEVNAAGRRGAVVAIVAVGGTADG